MNRVSAMHMPILKSVIVNKWIYVTYISVSLVQWYIIYECEKMNDNECMI